MAREIRNVVFVDGARTPFGKAGKKGIYADTRADDLVVKVFRELLRRNPNLPAERIDDVGVAATTQIGDQGLTIGRSAALLSGIPNTVPGYSIDRMCAGAMTAVTSLSSPIMAGLYDVALADAIRWARASIPTPASSPRRSSILKPCSWARPRRTCTTASRT